MDFRLTEDQQFFKDNVARLVDKMIKPRAEEIDVKDEITTDIIKEMGRLGYLGIRYPESVGGMAADMVTYALFIEEIARGSLSVGANIAMQTLMGTDFIFRFGSDEVKERCFFPALKGEKIGTIAFTEPNAGSDLANIHTTARKDGDTYVINGQKTWITNATVADFATVVASTDRSKRLKGLGFFLVERSTPGYNVGKKIHKLGTRGSENTELTFEDCRIPAENLLGEEGKGVVYLGQILADIRIMTGALALGLAKTAFDAGLQYSKERSAFGRPIAKFQLIASKLTEMYMSYEAARLMVYKAAWLKDNDLPHTKEAASAKMFATEMVCKVVDEVTRIYGAYGFAMEYPVQRYFRDARFLLYGGGTHEILKTVIARELTGRL